MAFNEKRDGVCPATFDPRKDKHCEEEIGGHAWVADRHDCDRELFPEIRRFACMRCGLIKKINTYSLWTCYEAPESWGVDMVIKSCDSGKATLVTFDRESEAIGMAGVKSVFNSVFPDAGYELCTKDNCTASKSGKHCWHKTSRIKRADRDNFDVVETCCWCGGRKHYSEPPKLGIEHGPCVNMNRVLR